MKNFLPFLGLGVLLLTSSCDKDFLDKQPQNDLVAENFYQSEEDAIKALNGAYHPLQKSGCYRLRLWTLDIVAGNSIVGAGGASDGLETQQMANFATTTANPGVSDIWSTHYQGLLAVNTALARIPAIDMDGSRRNVLLAEGHFVRALYYFNLVRLFGPVPLILQPQKAGDNLNVARTPVADVYAQIEQDLAFAEQNLPVRAATLGHATKGAAQGLLTKVYLTQAKWAQAAAKAREVVGLGVYSLNPNFAANFDVTQENGPESLFEVQYAYDPANNGFSGDAVCNSRSEFMAPRSSNLTPGGGFGWNQPTEEFVNQFEAGDRRKAVTVFAPGDQLGGFTYSANFAITGFNVRKFVVPTGSATTSFANDPLNCVVLRYADVLLMQAEALNEQEQSAAARAPLNEVRQRAGLLPVTSTSQATLREAILKERRLELAFENGERWFDLIRTKDSGGQVRALGFLRGLGTPNDQYGVGRGNISAKYLLLPIPQNERDANTAIDQNPGY